MKPETVSLIKKSNQVESDLTLKLGALGQGLLQGNLNGVNFSKITDLLGKLEELNNNIHEASASSSSGIYQSYSGKWLSTALKVTTVVVFLGTAAFVIYEWSQSSDGTTTGTTGFTATLAAAGTGFVQMINDYCKSNSDTEATAIKTDPPRPKTQVAAIKDIVQHIITMLEKTGEEANDALVKYKAVYPYLPSSIKKVFPDPQYWHMDLVSNPHPLAYSSTPVGVDADADSEQTVERDENDAESSGDGGPQIILSPGNSPSQG
jgi:hypothetical protein